MFSLFIANIMVLFKLFVLFFMFNKRLKPNSWLRCHDSVQNPHVFFLKSSVGGISLIFFNLSHIVGLSGKVSTSRHQVVRGGMEHLSQFTVVFLARLKLERALTVYYSLNFLKKYAVCLFDLICSVFFELHGFGIRNCN